MAGVCRACVSETGPLSVQGVCGNRCVGAERKVVTNRAVIVWVGVTVAVRR